MKAYGHSDSDSIKNSTFHIANSLFEEAPNFTYVKINNEEIGVRVLDGKDTYERYLLLRPESALDVGTILTYKEELWLVFNTIGEMFSPKSRVQLCNDTLKWEAKDGSVFEIPTAVSSSKSTKYDIASNELQVLMLQGGVYAYVQSNELTRQIMHSQRFILGSNVYEISGIDDLTYVDKNNNGIIQFTLRVTTKRSEDDFIKNIADNSFLYANSVEDKDEDKEEEGGGTLW